MNGNSHPTTLWGIIGICATVAVASATAGWIVARAYLGDELDQIRRSREWHLPENLAALGDLSRRLTLQLEERRQLEEVRQRLPQLEQALLAANRGLGSEREKNELLQKRLQSLEGNTFELREGDSRFIVPDQLALGVDALSSLNHTASVHLGKQADTLHPGEPIEAEVAGVKHAVVFLRTDGQIGVFSLSGLNPNPCLPPPPSKPSPPPPPPKAHS